ncbi:MAG: isoprenylcysteine carboxylmethyltransferase family protein [Gammaproteobacteria bacterium]|nr:MAG: isoprenylcysteine carboxylmethyltransferase family protein [Gammaproteobacteria bacterium]RKZ69367.1 MAG: isoprenylcysteine carboxylmethyltransferase family protein [Gammaproteobacteria bacterium]
MVRLFAIVYGSVAYLAGFLTLLYAIGFLGGFPVPKTINSGVVSATGTSIIINLLLLTIFALQHSIMARPAFKKWWTQYIPEHLERSTYVLLTAIILTLLYWQWRPMTDVVWHIDSNIGTILMNILFWSGWIILFASTFMTSHTDLFGLRQVFLKFKNLEYQHLEFKISGLYKFVRHPLMTGIIIAFWSTPHMSTGHLLFAAVSTAYILVALQFEEHDLKIFFGEKYADYKRQVSMLLPLKINRD